MIYMNYLLSKHMFWLLKRNVSLRFISLIELLTKLELKDFDLILRASKHH